MKNLLFVVVVLCYSLSAFGWGQTGHRAVGLIAQKHVSKKAKKQLHRILGHESLAMVSVWMDDIRSDPAYAHTYDWHWVTIPDGMTYYQTEKNEKGDAIEAIERLIAELKAGGLSAKQEAEHVKMLVHIIGDIHQPLHVGTGKDKGGNEVKVKWFWEDSNLHRVWDSGMIDSQKLSYSELAESIDHVTKLQVEQWQNTGVRDWAEESVGCRPQVYDFPDDGNLNYKYRYKNWGIVQQRLLQAGIRLAGVLNDIYG